ncbi:ribosomal L7Ae/L30e/S12e/Gadd45 family protein [Candidatus Woesearchaeota archaeon]|nr:ribosomal L7Ae/L30e/S12e/Gadd45 family protein [Candidatus Woesearchaeota archaeon]
MIDLIKEVKDTLKDGKVVLGAEQTTKLMKQGKLNKVFLSSNCKEDVQKDLQKYAKISKVKLVNLSIPNKELGIICKKPFSISMIGVLE